MFHNTKRLIDEKILQQYYFEKLMLSDQEDRRDIYLPEKFARYAATTAIKGLHPEVDLGELVNGKRHITDFVLYPMPNTGLGRLNIELKWRKEDFERQPERFEHYDGRKGQGFVVCFSPDWREGGRDFVCGSKPNIPVVYLPHEGFQQWFATKADLIVTQAFSREMDLPPRRVTGEKFWLVAISGAAEAHYEQHGRERGIWAFRDRESPKGIMDILEGDYVAFVRDATCDPGRMFFPHQMRTSSIETLRGSIVASNSIRWSIGAVDILRVSRGYHLNFTNKPPYDGFDEDWKERGVFDPANKEFTQFICLDRSVDAEFAFAWSEAGKPRGTRLDRSLFPERDESLSEFVHALRRSHNNRGNAEELSRKAFMALRRLLASV